MSTNTIGGVVVVVVMVIENLVADTLIVRTQGLFDHSAHTHIYHELLALSYK